MLIRHGHASTTWEPSDWDPGLSELGRARAEARARSRTCGAIISGWILCWDQRLKVRLDKPIRRGRNRPPARRRLVV